jgi:hypothetical protein
LCNTPVPKINPLKAAAYRKGDLPVLSKSSGFQVWDMISPPELF